MEVPSPLTYRQGHQPASEEYRVRRRIVCRCHFQVFERGLWRYQMRGVRGLRSRMYGGDAPRCASPVRPGVDHLDTTPFHGVCFFVFGLSDIESVTQRIHFLDYLVSSLILPFFSAIITDDSLYFVHLNDDAMS